MNKSEELLRSILAEVLRGQAAGGSRPFAKQKDPSGVIAVRTATVECEPFQQDGVRVRDLLTLEEAPRIGAGVMELDAGTKFPWELTYDEYDLVLEGTLEIEIDGRTVSGGPGDILYIPKGSKIAFCSQTATRYAYFVFPASWNS